MIFAEALFFAGFREKVKSEKIAKFSEKRMRSLGAEKLMKKIQVFGREPNLRGLVQCKVLNGSRWLRKSSIRPIDPICRHKGDLDPSHYW